VNIYEYQAKEIFKKYGINIPKGRVISDPNQAEDIVEEIGGDSWVIKAQIFAGGRGKAGGIKIANSPQATQQYIEEILNKPLKTYQSGDSAKRVKKVLVEECCDIAKELYFGITIDNFRSKVVCIASPQGGVEIEEVAKENPQLIFKEYIDPLTGLMPYQARTLSFKLGLADKELLAQVSKSMINLYNLFIQYDCSLVEVNPLAVTRDGRVVALDAKLQFDDSGLFRHPDIVQLQDLEEESDAEKIAREAGVSYVSLDGDIGCMVNGAGLAMATMDCIKVCGGRPANFLDVGGGASVEMISKAFQILMSDEKVKVILINIFGGILRCDVLAEGVVSACQKAKPQVPLVVRLEGSNVEIGRKILKDSRLNIISEDTMEGAAKRAVELAKGSTQ
jgi:succinyl-CoA synthetase beta subunit